MSAPPARGGPAGRLATFERRFALLLHVLICLVGASIGLFTVLIAVNLVLVKMQWGSLWWLHEAVEYTLYVGVFLGAPWVLSQGAHVRVDVLLSALPMAASRRLEQAVSVIGAALCLVLCVYGVRMGISEFVDGTMPDKDLRIPTWTMMAVFAVSFVLLTIEFALRVRRVGRGEAPASNAGF